MGPCIVNIFQYITVVVLYCFVVCACTCECMSGFCNVCFCEGFVMCGCFGNMHTVL
jgi:hypothetical protein